MVTTTLERPGPAPGPDTELLVLVLGTGLVVAAVLAAVRIIPPDERAVVLRFGRIARVAGPGLVTLVPWVERVVRVEVEDRPVTAPVVRATTQDDVGVWLSATARCRVVDPARSVEAARDARTFAAEALEEVIRQRVSRLALRDLVHTSPGHTQRLLEAANERLADTGIAVTGLEIDSVDLQLGPELLHWADRQRRV